MNRYIDATELLNEFHRYAYDTEDLHIDLIEDIVNDEPTADVRKNFHAKKIISGGEYDGATCWFECSHCHGTVDIEDAFCKHCGAVLEYEK